MKQLALVLLIAATSLSVSAQRNHRDNDQRDRVERNHDKSDRFNNREKQEFKRQIARINHEYDSKIHSIQKSPFMRARVKSRRVTELEGERRHSLNECRAKFYREMDYAERGRNNKKNRW
jgi:uncharacterized protein YecT (DUF1311 family)